MVISACFTRTKMASYRRMEHAFSRTGARSACRTHEHCACVVLAQGTSDVCAASARLVHDEHWGRVGRYVRGAVVVRTA